VADYPQSILEFREFFPDEESCRAYLARLRWPEGFRCPACQGKDFWMTDRALYHCRACHHQTSVTAGTLFTDTHLPLRLWFEATWHMTSQKYGASALGLQRVLGLGSYRTAWNLLHKFRRAMVRPGRDRLDGEVEVDETFIGGPRAGKRGRGAEGKALVVIAAQAAEQKIGRIRMLRVADASGPSLEAAVAQMVAPRARVRTDDWNGYNGLGPLGYAHAVVRPAGPGKENLLPLVNRVGGVVEALAARHSPRCCGP
jgi:transposase-like protein